MRKFDWRILPGLSCLYLLCFLDRTYQQPAVDLLIVGTLGMLGQITEVCSNRRLQGLESDLGMTGDDYNLALCVFFVTYGQLVSGLTVLDISSSRCHPILL